MSVIYLVLPLALLLGGLFLWAFLWAVRQGQFDDMQTPAIRLALEDREPAPTLERSNAPQGPASAPAGAEIGSESTRAAHRPGSRFESTP